MTRNLKERKPHEQLEKIRSCLTELRSALLEHFTLADVLLEVGDRKLGQ